ncbi:hypothetical protein NDR86_22035 [Nocardia sp. CDC141]|uniref:Uncharacterized protein n=1 Tax=Nocardia pulmonis TaxID=2951408 RepID=A0A9X2IYX8_9NOCA|nr:MULTISPECIES: hypothetical protein [Nocardia]MCM6776169.1 hypothetical protein [Nocardia pulmonis]
MNFISLTSTVTVAGCTTVGLASTDVAVAVVTDGPEAVVAEPHPPITPAAAISTEATPIRTPTPCPITPPYPVPITTGSPEHHRGAVRMRPPLTGDVLPTDQRGSRRDYPRVIGSDFEMIHP